ncbi:Type 1 glutamine amidotransferase-like domain-containing protein [Actinobacillus seminis]|nr:Type 1 glutamine amidotransferase-like domain-containing protein [Actinobacillus seminis]
MRSEVIEQAGMIAISGDNTFCLLNGLYAHQLIEPIRAKLTRT